MKQFLTLILGCALIFSLAACTQTEKKISEWGAGGAAVGALAGAAFGKGTGAVLGGAAAGAAIGSLIGYSRTKNGVRYCHYRGKNGRVHERPCK